jgi:aromatic ring-cleaving dioxygenase
MPPGLRGFACFLLGVRSEAYTSIGPTTTGPRKNKQAQMATISTGDTIVVSWLALSGGGLAVLLTRLAIAVLCCAFFR